MLKRLLLLVSLVFATVAMTKAFVGHEYFGSFRVCVFRTSFEVRNCEGSMIACAGRRNDVHTAIGSNFFLLPEYNRSFDWPNFSMFPQVCELNKLGFGWNYCADPMFESIGGGVAIPFWLLGVIWLAVAVVLAVITRVKFSFRDMMIFTAVCAGTISLTLAHYNPMPVIGLSVIALPLIAGVLFARSIGLMKFNAANLVMLTLVVGLCIALVITKLQAMPDVFNSSLDWKQLKQNMQIVEIFRPLDGAIWTPDNQQNDAILQWIKNNRDLYTGRPELAINGFVFDEYQVDFEVEDGIYIRFQVRLPNGKETDEFESLFIMLGDPMGNMKAASAKVLTELDKPE